MRVERLSKSWLLRYERRSVLLFARDAYAIQEALLIYRGLPMRACDRLQPYESVADAAIVPLGKKRYVAIKTNADRSTSGASKKKAHMIREAASPQSEMQHQGAPIIYLVDDDPSFLRALSRRLQAADYRVETFGSAEEFLTRRCSDAAGCAVLDLQMPGPGGLELQEALIQADEPLPVVFLTAHGDISSSVHAMKQGAVDYLTKPVRGRELLDAVQRALARGAAARETQRQKREWRARYESLTPREREVFALVVRGLLNKQIADVLGTSERTIRAHRGQVMHKMGVQSPAELGRAVEWLGEVFRANLGATGESRG